MQSMALALALVLALAVSPLEVNGENTHNNLGKPRRSGRNAFMEHSVQSEKSLENELHDAVSAALGDGHGFNEGRLLDIRRVLQPMWASILKSSNGRIDRRLLRYMVNRYFMQEHYISMVGLEPESMSNAKSEVALLMEHAPLYVKGVLEGKGAQHGFSLEDAVGMVAALERLVGNAGSDVLGDIYKSVSSNPSASLTREGLSMVVRKYIIRWMIGDDPEIVDMLEANATLLQESFNDWDAIEGFGEGQIQTFIHEHQLRANSPSGASVVSKRPHGTYNPLQTEFHFQDAEVIVGSIAKSFGRFWETECASIKTSLVAMDPDATGRIKLSTFYNTAMNGEWRFSESKEYLRQLGALDESSSWKGPQVIIPNYLQGASNCIVSAPHYRVCCAQECENFFGELEAGIGGPVGSVEQILPLVEKMTLNLDDEKAKLTTSLVAQLRRISEVHSGQIPLHGRLFAQWLHYVFPRECPFPHKAGVATMQTPLEFSGNYLASNDDMEHHVAQGEKLSSTAATTESSSTDDEEARMSLWSHEEELLSDYAHLSAPWEASRVGLSLFFVLASVALVVGALKWAETGKSLSTGFSLGAVSKDHLV